MSKRARYELTLEHVGGSNNPTPEQAFGPLEKVAHGLGFVVTRLEPAKQQGKQATPKADEKREGGK